MNVHASYRSRRGMKLTKVAHRRMESIPGNRDSRLRGRGHLCYIRETAAIIVGKPDA